MSRTIHYRICGDFEDGPIPESIRDQILDAQRQMNQMFTWTYESIRLELTTPSELVAHADLIRSQAPLLGWGWARVANDDWNAALVIRFLRWTSTLLPAKCYVRLYDEGAYVIPEFALFRHGQISLDESAIERHRKYLGGKPEPYQTSFEANVAAGRTGRWFRSVLALEYQGHPEIAKLQFRMDTNRYEGLTVDEAADEMSYPWSQAQAKVD